MPRESNDKVVWGVETTGTEKAIAQIDKLTKKLLEFNKVYNQRPDIKQKRPTNEAQIRATLERRVNEQSQKLFNRNAINQYQTGFGKSLAQLQSSVFQSGREAELGFGRQQSLIDQQTKLKWQEEHLPEIISLEKERQEINDKIAKATGRQQTGLQKLGNTFKRIGFYRVARLTFSTIEKGLSQGVSDYAKFDSGMNNTMSQLQSSSRLITSSIGMLVGSLMQLIAPLVQTLGNALAKISNGIAATQAKQKGLTKYTRINLEYWEEYNKEINKSLLSFDKFETLSGNQDEGPFQTAEISQADEDIAGITEGIKELVPIITAISSIAIIKWILDGGPSKLKDTISSIGNLFANPTKLLKIAGTIATIYTVVTNVLGIITEVQDLVKNWDTKTTEEKVTSFLKIALKLLLGIAAIVGLITQNWVLVGTAAAITAGMQIAGFAQGGVPDKGSLFYAGEAGAELVHSMPSGNTGVTNVAQFKQAMVEAIYECSDVFYNGEGNVVLNLDGAEIARSRRFKAEMNRTNSGLNLV